MRAAVLLILAAIVCLLWASIAFSTEHGAKDAFGTNPTVKAQLTRVAIYAAFTATPSPTPGPAPTFTPTPEP